MDQFYGENLRTELLSLCGKYSVTRILREIKNIWGTNWSSYMEVFLTNNNDKKQASKTGKILVN